MSRLESELRQAFERRLTSIPARADLRARVNEVVARRTSRVNIWQVTAATAGLLLLGAVYNRFRLGEPAKLGLIASPADQSHEAERPVEVIKRKQAG